MTKCIICKNQFTKRSMTHKACSPDCGEEVARRKREKLKLLEEKKDRLSIKLRKEKLKTRSDWIKEAQIAFNAFVRARDIGKLCICCDKQLQDKQIGGGFDCGHYRSIGSAPHLRFDIRNAHGQSKQCNRYGAGRAVDYRIGLIARIGLEAVESLEADQTIKKWTIDELKSIKAEYKAKLKEMK